MELFGITPFDGLSPWQVAALALIYLGSFFVKGIFGFGAVPLLIVAGSFVVEPHHAVVLAGVTNLMTHLNYMPDGWRNGQRALVGRMIIYLVPSIAVGVAVFSFLGGGSLSILAGLIILGSVLVDAFRLLDPLAPMVRRQARIVGPVFGMISGFISGLVGAGSIAFVGLYIRMFAPDKAGFRATIILVTAVILTWRAVVLVFAGLITMALALEALILLPGSLLAGVLGARLSKRLSDEGFFTAYRVVLCAGATLMIWRGAGG
jgi:uncharacterized membrane protein YfcA